MEKLEYITDPARACFLSYHKNENTELPSNMRVVRGDDYKPELYKGFDDTVYTKLILRDKQIDEPVYPEGFKLVTPTKEQLTAHIAQCFPDGETPDSIDLWRYMEYFMVALVDVTTGRIVASAAADVDFGVKEGSIDWVEVSPPLSQKGSRNISRNGAYLPLPQIFGLYLCFNERFRCSRSVSEMWIP